MRTHPSSVIGETPATEAQVPRRMTLNEEMNIEHFFGPHGKLAARLPHFEFRREQVAMAKRIERTLATEGHLLVEAGTGTGKTLAYLVPLADWVLDGDRRAIVSTFTKALQSQLIDKDLPQLVDRLDIPIRYALCLGAANYLCTRRFRQFLHRGSKAIPASSDLISAIVEWEARTRRGLRSELALAEENRIWNEISRSPDACLGYRCPEAHNCYYRHARQEQEDAHILVVNHHLFFANLASGGNVLPPFNAVVFDEAHNLEDVASDHFGYHLSNRQIEHLLNSVHNPRTRSGIVGLPDLFEPEAVRQIRARVREARAASHRFFGEILMTWGEGPSAVRIRETGALGGGLQEPLTKLASALTEASLSIEDEMERIEVEGLAARANAAAVSIASFLELHLEGHVHWISIGEGRDDQEVALHAAPVEVASHLRREVFEPIPPVAMTSATLTVDSRFDYLRYRLGFDDADELLLPSPFDTENNVLLYLPPCAPDPRREPNAFVDSVALETKLLLDASRGRAFVLFTSYEMMRRVSGLVNSLGSKHTLLQQGELPREQLLDRFRQDLHSTLFGVHSFWQGVDVPGEALQCVIIVKLPFDVPTDPVTEARMEALADAGFDPFSSYLLPGAIMMLRQGVGRLIRTMEDRGVIAILDPRVKTMSYGRYFLNSLPPCPVTESRDDIDRFFMQIPIAD